MRDLQSQALGGLIPRRVPDAYIRAEVAAFPLTSEMAFGNAMTELAPSLDESLGDGADAPTRCLWRDCEKALSEHASGWSLDRLIALRDFFWFSWPSAAGEARQSRRPQPVPMHRYLQHLTEVHLDAHPGATEVVESMESTALDAVTHYRWLTFALPEDVLLAATGAEFPPTRVVMEPPLLVRRLLDQGVTEIHHHVGAGMDFPLLWASLLAALASSALDPDALSGPGQPLKGGETWLRWLLAAVVTRYLLAEFLLSKEKLLPDFVASRGRMQPHGRRVLGRALRAMKSGKDVELPEFFELRDLYQDMHPTGSIIGVEGAPRTLDEVWRRCDPIAVRLSLAAPDAGERWLMLRALRRLDDPKNLVDEEYALGTSEFSRLFWQVLRVRCLLYRSIVQRPMTAGLQWFVRFADRIGAYRSPLRAARTEISYHVAGGGQPIAALEVRITPDPSPFTLAEKLWDLASSWDRVLDQVSGVAGRREPEFGVLLHFAKQRDEKMRWASGYPPAFGSETHGEPHPLDTIRLGGRYADYFVEQSTRAQAIVDLLDAVPTALWLVRGLDVASDELSVPTWVLVPLYRYVLWRSASAAATRSSEALPPLRLTAHVGEDFRHLMEGLRRVYECIQYVLKRSGGRLGHATALGVEPRLWAESVGSVMMPAEERLWDLVFEWRLYSHYRVPVELRAPAPPERVLRVEKDIHDLSERVFMRPCEPSELAEAHHVLHQLWCPPVAVGEIAGLGLDAFARALRRLDWDRVRSRRRVHAILEGYRENEAVFRRGQQLVDVTLDESEIAALQVAQDALRRCAGALGIVVEVNPSSNLLIGNLLDLRNHPILRLFPPEPQEGAPPAVPIAVGADDPVTFSTYLLREYSLLHEAAKGAGYSERAVLDWLAAIQQTSLDARFTVPWRPTARKKAGVLLNKLDDFLQRPRTPTSRRKEALASYALAPPSPME
jgi:hypothetical protein